MRLNKSFEVCLIKALESTNEVECVREEIIRTTDLFGLFRDYHDGNANNGRIKVPKGWSKAGWS